MTENTNIQQMKQFVNFLLVDGEYGIPISQVKEIIRYKKLTRLPKSANYIDGVLNLRGQIIPIVDLRRYFGFSCAEQSINNRIIIVELEKQTIGIVVDSVSEVRSIEGDHIEAPPKMGTRIDTEYISGMGKIDERLIMLLNLDLVFTEEEKMKISEAAA